MCICLLVWSHLQLIWPPVLPLNLVCICRAYHYRTCPIQTFYIPSANLHVYFHSLTRLSKDSVQFRRSLRDFVTRFFFFYGEDSSAPRPIVLLEDQPLFAVRGCLFTNSQLPSIAGGLPSIRKLTTRHVVMTETHLTWRTFCCSEVSLIATAVVL
jgi:hypothetical protein